MGVLPSSLHLVLSIYTAGGFEQLLVQPFEARAPVVRAVTVRVRLRHPLSVRSYELEKI